MMLRTLATANYLKASFPDAALLTSENNEGW